jgi:hypothetical protein
MGFFFGSFGCLLFSAIHNLLENDSPGVAGIPMDRSVCSPWLLLV